MTTGLFDGRGELPTDPFTLQGLISDIRVYRNIRKVFGLLGDVGLAGREAWTEIGYFDDWNRVTPPNQDAICERCPHEYKGPLTFNVGAVNPFLEGHDAVLSVNGARPQLPRLNTGTISVGGADPPVGGRFQVGPGVDLGGGLSLAPGRP